MRDSTMDSQSIRTEADQWLADREIDLGQLTPNKRAKQILDYLQDLWIRVRGLPGFPDAWDMLTNRLAACMEVPIENMSLVYVMS